MMPSAASAFTHSPAYQVINYKKCPVTTVHAICLHLLKNYFFLSAKSGFIV